MNKQIRVVVLKDENVFVAQCLEVDVAAQGPTAKDAVANLRCALNAESREAIKAGKTLADIGPAPEAFHKIYDHDVVDRLALVA